MTQRAFAGWLGRAEPKSRATATVHPAPVSALLQRGVSAVLLPHFITALASYGMKDQTTILAAYGVGCIILADLLSPDGVMPDRQAAAAALKTLAEQCNVPEFLEGDALDRAEAAAANLAQAFDQSGPYRDVCQMFDAGVRDLKERKTSDRGWVALKAAMARLEAMTLSARVDAPLAA